MSTWNALGAGGRAAVMVMGAAVVGGIGYLVWDGNAPPAPAPVAANLAEPAATEAAAPATAPAAEPAPAEKAVATEAPPAPVAPSFDNWRVEADGSAVVAGRAEPGSVISVLVDGAMVAEAEAANGEFAALFTLPPNDKPSLMSLEAKLPDGTVLPSEQTIAIEPIKGPVEVAAAEPAPEPAPAPAAVMVTEEGASVVQPATPVEPEVLANVSVDAITYTPSGAVQLGGAGTPGQFVRVYLDNAAKVTALIPDSGRWLSTMPAIEPGIYTLRVDQIDDAGKVTSRFETPFKRETPEALAAASGASDPAPEAQVPETTEVAAAETAVTTTEPAASDVVAETATTEAEAPAAQAQAEAATGSDAATPTPEAAASESATAEPSAPDTTAAESAAPEAPAAETAASPEAPAEPAATEPAATEPAATEAAPAEVQVAEAAPAEPVAAEPAPAQPVTVTVQPGFTLWRIAKENFGDGVMYVQVFEANKDKIRDPDLIYPGQVFTIPISFCLVGGQVELRAVPPASQQHTPGPHGDGGGRLRTLWDGYSSVEVHRCVLEWRRVVRACDQQRHVVAYSASALVVFSYRGEGGEPPGQPNSFAFECQAIVVEPV